MNRLAAILPPGNVLVNVDATSKKRVFEHAGLLFENQHSISAARLPRQQPGSRTPQHAGTASHAPRIGAAT